MALNSHRYQAQLKSETFTILKRGILWATYVSAALLFVVLLNTYFFDEYYHDVEMFLIQLVPLLCVIAVGLVCAKINGLFRVNAKQIYSYLALLVLSWSFVLYGLTQLSSQNMPGVESLSDVLVLVFALALFPNRNVMILGILPFLLFSALYHSMQYSQVLIYPLTKFMCFLGIIMSGQKIISGWFFKAVVRNIEKKKLLRQFKRLALIDGLTNISNRRHFDEVLLQEIKSSARNEQPLAVILLDIDYFKLLNDSLGHQVGDGYLIQVAEIVNSALERPRDLVARYGGEEFVVILPNTDIDGARSVAGKIQRMLADAELVHPSSGVSRYITASQGIALWHKGMQSSDLLERADSMLYKAKSSGRNQYFSE
ncbi:GGDEF domain-containing protein [Shewanella marinintestina]|uniref:GGDEF domain-containing protein n=1 Tax=Shewanella marinintestina TaxID=190305 RepID=UPI002010A9E7|nr:GGDEF domain-containing protein [Shewanella marinintestina]MCL1145670.1 GGDEF domain-containing protein [Shewanella marinintestina]